MQTTYTTNSPARQTTGSCPVCGGCEHEASYAGYVRCSHCRLLKNHPFPSLQEIADYYTAKASGGNYSAGIRAFDVQRADTYRRSVQHLRSIVPTGVRDRSVLDVGCFTGLSLDVIGQLGGDPYGLEFQPEAAAVAEAKHPGKVKVGDICSPPEFGHGFDIVTMTDVIEHVPNPVQALCQVHELLSADGWLLITTPNTGSLLAKGLRAQWPSLCPVHHLHLFDKNNLSRLLRQCGFQPVRTCALWKWYSFEYVTWIMPNFNTSLAKVCSAIPTPLRKLVLPLNGGEMLVIARKGG